MAKKPDAPCAGGCGKLLWSGRGSLVTGARCCRECRAAGRNPVPARVRLAGPLRLCAEPDCDRPHEARGLCAMHYKRTMPKSVVRSDDVILGAVADTPAGRRSVPARVVAQVVLATGGLFVYCPNPNHRGRALMYATATADRSCECGATVRLNPEEVSWVISETLSTAA